MMKKLGISMIIPVKYLLQNEGETTFTQPTNDDPPALNSNNLLKHYQSQPPHSPHPVLLSLRYVSNLAASFMKASVMSKLLDERSTLIRYFIDSNCLGNSPRNWLLCKYNFWRGRRNNVSGREEILLL